MGYEKIEKYTMKQTIYITSGVKYETGENLTIDLTKNTITRSDGTCIKIPNKSMFIKLLPKVAIKWSD